MKWDARRSRGTPKAAGPQFPEVEDGGGEFPKADRGPRQANGTTLGREPQAGTEQPARARRGGRDVASSRRSRSSPGRALRQGCAGCQRLPASPPARRRTLSRADSSQQPAPRFPGRALLCAPLQFNINKIMRAIEHGVSNPGLHYRAAWRLTPRGRPQNADAVLQAAALSTHVLEDEERSCL